MSIVTLPPFEYDEKLYAGDRIFAYSRNWQISTGATLAEVLSDVRNIQLGTAAGVEVIPGVQYAARRIDRPDDPTIFTSSAARTTDGVTKYHETLSNATKFFMRPCVGLKLSTGSFARVQGILHWSHWAKGIALSPEEIVVNPINGNTDVSVFRIGGGVPIALCGVDAIKFVVFGFNNISNTMRYRFQARVFNDVMQRGAWTPIGSTYSPASGDFDENTADISLSGVFTLADYQWIEFALGVWKNSGGDPNSRCIFHVSPALKLA